MARPLVSIVMPVRNAAATLERALISMQRQTSTDWELLAIDDGSSDGSRELLDSIGRAHARVAVCPSRSRGIVAALNYGIDLARGEFIARMDADDEMHPERLEVQARWLRERPELGLVSCEVTYGGDRTANAGYALHVDWTNTLHTSEEIRLNRFVESPFAHPSVMFRRELIERHGGYEDGDFPEDYELWLRWLEVGVKMEKIPQRLLTWFDPPERLSRTDPRYDADAFFRVKARYIAAEMRRRPAQRVWIWGAGRPTRKRAAWLEQYGVAIDGFVDVDAKKAGGRIGERRVILPEALPPPGKIFVLGYVAKRGAREYIRTQLTERGYVEGLDFLMCA